MRRQPGNYCYLYAFVGWLRVYRFEITFETEFPFTEVSLGPKIIKQLKVWWGKSRLRPFHMISLVVIKQLFDINMNKVI